MSRVRSPNYPAIGLGTAVEKIKSIHRGEGRNAVARDAMAKLIGYGGLNGGSATMLSALAKYGLIESVGDGEARITELAMQIIASDNDTEKRSAIEVAAFKPAIFGAIREKWPDRPPGDESLRSFLVRKGFTENALEQVIQFYREIIDMAPERGAEQGLGRTEQGPNKSMDESQTQTATPPVHPASGSPPPADLLVGGKPFNLAFDGSVLTGTLAIKSVRDINRLMKVLSAQKAAFEAMLDEENEESTEPGIC